MHQQLTEGSAGRYNLPTIILANLQMVGGRELMCTVHIEDSLLPPPSSLLNTVKFLLIYIIPRSVPLLEVLTKGGLMRVLNNWNYIGRNNEE